MLMRGLACGALAALVFSLALAPSALGGPRRAQFTYTYKAVQDQSWSYDNRLGPSECQEAPARGGGTQKSVFKATGRVEVTTDLARNVRKSNFNVGITRGQGTFDRRGTFVLQTSQLGICASPDVVLDTQRCGPTKSPFNAVLLYTGGRLETSGTTSPYGLGAESTCPFFFFSQANGFQQFRTSEPLDNDSVGGLLGTSQRVSGPQFFKRKKVVLRGARTQSYAPGGAAAGLVGKSAVSWTLTLKPRR